MGSRLHIGVLLLLLVSACGKNAPVSPNGTGYQPIAPAPSGNLPYYPYSGNGYSGNGSYPYGGAYPYGGLGGYPFGSPYGFASPGGPSGVSGYPFYFNPQLPPGFPSSYYPWLPLDGYFRNNPAYGPAYWNALWKRWYQTAQSWGVSPYDFSVFWMEFCPQVWTQGQEYGIYVSFQQTFYPWVTQATVFPPNANPQGFWTNYLGVIY